MKMTVKILAWRILRKMDAFQLVDQAPDSFPKVPLSTGEHAIGVYRNREDSSGEAILVTDMAIHLKAASRIRSCYFSTIERTAIPESTPKREISELLIHLKSGEVSGLPIRGGGERFRDAFEFLRFLNRVVRDVS